MARVYRKKPVTVEAVQWTGENYAEMCDFIDTEVFKIIPRMRLVIHTLEGDHHASPGDYIIKGVNGEFYPCKPDIFAKTYENAILTPLTLEQLREMDSIPIWVVDTTINRREWCYWKDELAYSCEDHPEYYDPDEYGLWVAYRRPPEEEV